MLAVTIFLFMATGEGGGSLARGVAALEDFRAVEAVELLEQARQEGPYEYRDHMLLYEQLGIAYAYLELNDEAIQAFDILLALDPGHIVPYTLSPKVTFLFERARKQSDARPPTAIDISWSRDLLVTDPTLITVEVLADPQALVKKIVLHARRKGAPEYDRIPVAAPSPGEFEQLVIPPVASSTEPSTIQLFLTAHDERNNEVFLLGDPTRPREIALGYEPPTPWYGRWWVWAITGVVVAAGTGAAVYVATLKPPTDVPATGESSW